MSRITEELLRKSSEHNEGIISTLEELALHQRDLIKIEWLDKWCRELKILDLTSNLISKIENLGRLKKLEYLKLGLNNIEVIKNLEGCESLQKLDLTVNFIGKLTSIESLKTLEHLKEIYLVGNPCTQYENYRQFVVATLPQLLKLDGVEITKSERIVAFQALEEIRGEILDQQKRHEILRAKQKMKSDDTRRNENIDNNEELTEEEKEKKFWSEPSEYTPESRINLYEHRHKSDQKDCQNPEELKKETLLVTKDGRRLNVNEPKLKFKLTEDEDGKNIILDVALFRYLDSSFCNVDVQPTYVQVIVKGKVLQLVLPEEVNAEKSKAERSQTSGRLIVTMPRMNMDLKGLSTLPKFSYLKEISKANVKPCQKEKKVEKLEIDPSCKKTIDFRNICKEGNTGSPFINTNFTNKTNVLDRPNSIDFVDDDNVPPLE